MTRIESDIQKIKAAPTDVFAFLTDLRNYEQLMPSMVSQFSATEKTADFELSGLGKVHVEIGNVVPNASIGLIPSGKLPFRFDLVWELRTDGDDTLVTAVANADLNMFMKMMAEPQLKKFVQAQAETLGDHFRNQNP